MSGSADHLSEDEEDSETGEDASPKAGLISKDENDPRNKNKYDASRGCCHCNGLTRNEKLCLMAGSIATVFVVVMVVVAMAVALGVVVTRPKGGGSHAEVSDIGDGEEKVEVPWSKIRLQPSVTPEYYDLRLTLDLDSFEVTGSVDISCSVHSDVDYIAVHVKDMTISGPSVERDGKMVEHNTVLYYENDFFVFNLSKPLEPGGITITLHFNYTLLQDKLSGLYRSFYMNEDGEKQYLATTQFESTSARRAFPCFDEPAFKANFSTRVTHHPRYRAWSNMPAEAVRTGQNSSGMVTTHFQTSMKMSTYLVAFVVSDFRCVNSTLVSTSGSDVLVRVCSNPLMVEHTNFALKVAMDVVQFYEREFGVAYPLPKLDLFAIPDFSAGAMENWGLVLYRETVLLYNEATDPVGSKQQVAVVIAHELAHQWFGDLVTMAWWDGLWLNEGFASFMECIGVNSTEPSLHMMDQFVAKSFVSALKTDGLNESHPILQEVRDPSEIRSLFDGISYSKGACIIRMLSNFIGKDAFKAGITLYLNQHRYGNAETYELWEALQNKAQQNEEATVTEIMDTWTKQMGYPIFTVNQTSNTLTQERFFSVKPDNVDSIAASPYNYIWKAPFDFIHYSASGDHTITNISLVTSQTTSMNWPSGGWIKANKDQQSFYRVNYEVSNWLGIVDYLKNNNSRTWVLTCTDRAGLIDDAFALSYAGMLDTTLALNLSIYLVQERDYVPWRVAIGWFYQLGALLIHTPRYNQYRDFVDRLLRPVTGSLPPSSNNLDTLLRSLVLSAAAHFGSANVIQDTMEVYKQWRFHNVSVDPNLKSLIYGVGVAEGGEEDWNYIWQLYLQSNEPIQQKLYLVALTKSNKPWILNRYLNYSISKIRPQDTLSVVIGISQNVHGRLLAWDFVQNNWPYFREKFGAGTSFDRFVQLITADFTTESELQQVKDLFARDTGFAPRGFQQAIEVIRGNIAWLNIYTQELFNNTHYHLR